MQRVEALLKSCGCVDPLAHLFSHLELDLVDRIYTELIGITYAKAFTMALF